MPLVRKNQLRENIKRDLMKPMMTENDAEFLAEFLIKEGLGDSLTGPGMDAGQMEVGAAMPKWLGGQGAPKQLELMGEMLLWLPDALANLVQWATSTQEEDVGWFIKALRVGGRVFGFASIGLGKAFLKAAKMPFIKKLADLGDAKPEKPAVADVAGGAPQLGAGSPAGRAGIAERKRSLKRRR